MTTVTVALAVGILVGVAAIGLQRARHGPPSPPPAAGPALVGVAVTALGPHGIVRVESEEWSATTEGAPVAVGEPVRVLGRRGLRLRVRRAAGGSAATDKAVRQAWNR
jgi:membrane-bound ClpP family serine protease